MANEFKIKNALQILQSQPVQGISDSSIFTIGDTSTLATKNAIKLYVDDTSLSGLLDVSIGGLADKNVLVYNSAVGKWENEETLDISTLFALKEEVDASFGLYETKINIDASFANIKIEDLSDVSIVGVTDGSVLIYESTGSYWTYGTAGGGTLTDVSLGGLNDVTITDASLNDIIVVDESGVWVNQQKLWTVDSSLIKPLNQNYDVQLNFIEVNEDAGAITLVDMPISSTPSIGTEESYSFNIDENTIFKIYSEADGSAGLQETAIVVAADYQYMGNPGTDGSWRFYVDGSGDLVFEKRVTGTWTEAGKFTV